MAFPLPEHLPRAAFSQEGTSFGSTSSHAEPFLKKIASTSYRDINHERATVWVKELDKAILDTKERLRSKIQSNLALFEQQLESSHQVQTRLQSLSTSVDDLSDVAINVETGILPTTLGTLGAHSELAQRRLDAELRHSAASHLLKCRDEYRLLQTLAADGRLPEAVKQSEIMGGLLAYTPDFVRNAPVVEDLKKLYRISVDRIQEQLSQAYDDSIIIQSNNNECSLRVESSVAVSGSSSTISLEDIFASMASETLNGKIGSLRKDIMGNLVIPLLSASSASGSSNDGVYRITFSATPVSDSLQILEELLRHIHATFITSLPPSIGPSFSSALYRPVAEGMLSHLLRPAVPSSIEGLPAFLERVQKALNLEEKIVAEFGINSGRLNLVQDWATDVGSHYERGRRELIISAVRDLIEDREGESTGVGIRVEEAAPLYTAQETEDSAAPSEAVSEIPVPPINNEDEESAWNFDDDTVSGTTSVADSLQVLPPATPAAEVSLSDGDDGWGFDDDAEPLMSPIPSTAVTEAPGSDAASVKRDEWGWDELPPTPQIQIPSHKTAGSATGMSITSSEGVVAQDTNPPVPTMGMPPKTAAKRAPTTYLVSLCATKVLDIAEHALVEGKELSISEYFPPPAPRRGNLLLTAALSLFDLFRALYPTAHSETLSASFGSTSTYSSVEALQFSNDCKYLAYQVPRLQSLVEDAHLKTRLSETRERLNAAGETWFHKTIDIAIDAVGSILSRTNGFVDSSEEVHFQVCQGAVDQALEEITRSGNNWKNTLSKSSYYDAVGSIVDDTLGRVIDDITALPDIPEIESHRLSELLRMLMPLEELFLDGDQSLVVMYVPLWLKFSYLAELLEASMNDISYLFDEGALVDFTVPELTRLVRALFADTPLRARTIERISAGHPAVV